MKLDQKYFVPFLAVTAIATALLITFFTISSQKGQRQSFRNAITTQDSLRSEKMQSLNHDDSLSVSTFPDKFVVLDFWSTWSNFSEDVHKQLSDLKREYPDTLEVIAAVVQDQPSKIDAYINRHKFSFHFVNGTEVFNKYDIPGMPTEIIYDSKGNIIDVFFGYSDSTHFERLRTLLKHEE